MFIDMFNFSQYLLKFTKTLPLLTTTLQINVVYLTYIYKSIKTYILPTRRANMSNAITKTVSTKTDTPDTLEYNLLQLLIAANKLCVIVVTHGGYGWYKHRHQLRSLTYFLSNIYNSSDKVLTKNAIHELAITFGTGHNSQDPQIILAHGIINKLLFHAGTPIDKELLDFLGIKNLLKEGHFSKQKYYDDESKNIIPMKFDWQPGTYPQTLTLIEGTWENGYQAWVKTTKTKPTDLSESIDKTMTTHKGAWDIAQGMLVPTLLVTGLIAATSLIPLLPLIIVASIFATTCAGAYIDNWRLNSKKTKAENQFKTETAIYNSWESNGGRPKAGAEAGAENIPGVPLAAAVKDDNAPSGVDK